MAASGMKVLTHCNDINFMGFWEVAQATPAGPRPPPTRTRQRP